MKPMLSGFVLIFVFLLSLSSFAQSSQGSAWFVDSSRTVRYCIESDSKFSLTPNQVETYFQWAISTWSTYMDETGVSKRRPTDLRPARNFERTNDCGSADLQILLGLHSAKIDQYKKEDFFHPIAFAKRISFDAQAGWSQGLLWIADDSEFSSQFTGVSWKESAKIKGILLHELGHIFGVSHRPETIMREDILDLLLLPTGSATYQLTHIENAWELISSKDKWKNGSLYSDLGEMSPQAFSLLLGRAPQGSVQVQWMESLQQMILQDDLGQYVLKLEFVYEKNLPVSTEPLFYSYRKTSTDQIHSWNETRESFVKIGTLTASSGSSIPVIAEKNLTEREMKFSFLAPGALTYGPLFSQPCRMVDVPFNGPHCMPVYPGDEG